MKKKYLIGIFLGLLIIGLMVNVPKEQEMRDKLIINNENYKKESKDFSCYCVVKSYTNYLLFSTLDYEKHYDGISYGWGEGRLIGIGGNILGK